MSGAPSTATEPASNGHRRQNRKDFSGILGRLRRRGGLDVEAFVDEVLAELAAMEADGTKPTRSGPKPSLTGAALRRAIMAIWCLCFCGMQWRAIGQLCDIPVNTLFSLFARWTRLGLWRRLLDRLRRAWRLACGDKAEPSAVVIDSRSCKSA